MKRTAFAAVLSMLIALIGGGVFYIVHTSKSESIAAAVADSLVNDPKFGGRAIQRAISCGDAFLPALEEASEDFALLDSRNCLWIAEVLGAIKTERAEELLIGLYNRKARLCQLVGAVGLATHGKLPEVVDRDCLFVRVLLENGNQAEVYLAIVGLGETGTRDALPFLFDLLKRRNIDYWYHAYACRSVARINASDGIPILRECLMDSQFFALAGAFQALIDLGDKEAVGFAIQRVSPSIRGLNSGLIVKRLEAVTGQSFGFDRDRWMSWWKLNREKWRG